MNDRYLYRAKRTDNGEWAEGNLVWSDDADDDYKAIIIPVTGSNMFTTGGENVDLGFEKWYRVNPSTICQCTGLKDKNGKLIWENDIVKKEFYTDYDAFANSEEYIGVVKYEDCAWCVSYERDGRKCNSPIFMAMEYHDAEHFNVIGNIFDEGSENIGKGAEEN